MKKLTLVAILYKLLTVDFNSVPFSWIQLDSDEATRWAYDNVQKNDLKMQIQINN